MEARAASVLLLAVLIGVSAAAAAGYLPSWYRCTCPANTAATGCVCPSLDPPGGLARADTPQFILFSHDDAITEETHSGLRSIFEHGQAACRPVATLFTLARATNCSLLQQLYNNGYEVASHTLTHQRMNEYSREQVVAEVAGGRAMLAATCGIPDGDIVGFRAPFLQSRPTLRQVLHGAGGFLYDSSLLEEAEGSIARGLAARVWPYSMDGGIPQDCSRWSPAQECNQRERYPGLFQVPVWVAQDWAKDSRGAYKILKSSFDAAYEGNRAPLPIFIHTSWFEDHLDGMLQFIDYVQSKPHAYFVTMRQLLAWMQRPVPAGQLTPAALGCGQPGGAGLASGTIGPLTQPPDPAATHPPPAPQATGQRSPPSPVPSVPAAAASTLAQPQQPTMVPAVPAGLFAAAQGAGDSRGPVSTASTPSASWEPATGSAEASPAASSSAINVVAVAGGVAGGVVATLLLTTTACFMVKRRQERDRSAAAGGAGLPQGPHQGGVTAHISGSAAAGMGVKTRAARLAEEDSAYSSSPRFMLTPRTRIGDMA